MNRKSVRVFEDKEITPEIKDIILAAAMRAPTGGNWHAVPIIDGRISPHDKLAGNPDHQPWPFIAQAKTGALFLCRLPPLVQKVQNGGLRGHSRAGAQQHGACNRRCRHRRTHGLASPRKVSASVPAISATLWRDSRSHKELLNLPPPQVAPLCMLVFGYPTQQQKGKESRQLVLLRAPSCLRTGIVSFRKKSCSRMMPNDRTKAFYNRKYVSDFAQENGAFHKRDLKNRNSKE